MSETDLVQAFPAELDITPKEAFVSLLTDYIHRIGSTPAEGLRPRRDGNALTREGGESFFGVFLGDYPGPHSDHSADGPFCLEGA